MRNNLIIVCAGNESLHWHWVRDDRNYDIMIIYFGDNQDIADAYQQQSDYFYREKGLKLDLARKILLHELHFRKKLDFAAYKFIWFADDDLLFDDCYNPNQLFDVALTLKADIFQPAIQNNNFNPMWEDTRMIADAFAHRTNIVEFMMPGFSGEVFCKCLFSALHALDYSKAGWGVEVILMRIGEAFFNRPLRTFVIDSLPINHTRYRAQGGGQGDQLGEYEATYLPQIHTNRMRTMAVYKTADEAIADNRFEIERDERLIEHYHQVAYQRRYK